MSPVTPLPQTDSETPQTPYLDSYAFGRIIELATATGIPDITRHSLTNLLKILEPDPNLQRLFLVFDNLQLTYDLVSDICQGQWKPIGRQILDTQKTAEALLTRRDFFNEYIPDLDRKAHAKGYYSRKASVRGSIGKHPLWCTFVDEPVQELAFGQYRHLLAQILVSLTVLANHPAKHLIARTKYRALEAVRVLADERTSREFLNLPSAILAPDAYLAEIEQLPADYRIHDVEGILGDALDFIAHTAEPHLSGSDDENEELIPTDLPIEIIPPDLGEVIDPVDIAPGRYSILAGSSLLPKHLEYVTGAQISKSLAKANQLFPFSWSSLSSYDVDILLDLLSEQGGEPSDSARLRAKSILQLMFWAGLTEDRLAVLPLFSPQSDQSEFLNPQTGTLRLRSDYPRLKMPMRAEARQQLFPRQEHIDIPLPSFAMETITTYLAARGEAPSLLVFQLSPGEIRSEALGALRATKKAAPSLLNLHRIQTYLQNRLARTWIGDPALAVLTLGKETFLGRTKVHYASTDAYNLAELYRKTAHEILGKETYEPQYPLAESLHVGTPKRPKVETVRKLAGDLVDRIKAATAKKSRITVEEFVEFHNLYTAYTVLVVSFSTGHRAVSCPYLYKSAYDQKSGFCVVRDKDTTDYYHTRLIGLPDICTAQLRHYQTYLDLLIGAQGNTAKAASPADKKQAPEQPLILLHIIEGRIVATDVRPKTLGPIYEGLGYFVSLNAQRSFLKSELQEAGCAPDAIELFLGHWEIGEEGFTRSSSLFPADYKEEIKKYLPPLLREIGLAPLRGLTRIAPDFRLDPLDIPKTTPRQTRRKDNKTSQWQPDRLPGEPWYRALGTVFREQSFDTAFSAEQKWVLQRLQEKLPALYDATEEQGLCQKELDDFYRKLAGRGVDPISTYKRQVFMYRALSFAKQDYGWDFTLPPPPKVIPKERNLIRPQLGQQLGNFRDLERKFVKDLENPPPQERTLRAGQILLSAILFGMLHHRNWFEGFMPALAQGMYQFGDWLWLDLWAKNESPKGDEERLVLQMNPRRYRRWVADPVTQMIIYRWLRLHPEDRELLPDIDPAKAVAGYLKHLDRSFKAAEAKFTALAKLGTAAATISTPPFLTAYARNLLLSASLPDERWLRAACGRTVPLRRAARETVHINGLPAKSYLRSHQNDLRKSLCQLIEAHKNDPDGNRQRIRSYLEEHQGQLNPVMQLLAGWGIYLFSDKTSPRDRHIKKGPLAESTVTNYLTLIADPLFAACRSDNPLEFDDEEYRETYEQFASFAKHKLKISQRTKSTSAAAQGYVKVMQTLQLFHRYLEICYDAPYVMLDDLIGKESPDRYSHVSANILTEEDYLRVLSALNWQSPALTRLQTMQVCALALLYRTGMRRNEMLGLRLKDIAVSDQIQILMRPHRGRRGKTRSAKRRLLFSLRATEKEQALFRKLLSQRSAEPGTKPDSYLFTSSAYDDEMISDEELLGKTRQLLKEITQDEAAVIHHCRHSFDSLLVCHQMVREDIELTTVPAFFQSGLATPLHPDMQQSIMGNEVTGRKKLHATAILMGHADVPTGLHHYVHLCDFLCGYYARHITAAPDLNAKAIASLTGTSEKRGHQLRLEVGHPLLRPLALHAARHSTQLEHPLLTQATPPGLLRPEETSNREVLPSFDHAYRAYLAQTGHRALKRGGGQLPLLRTWYDNMLKLPPRRQVRLIRVAGKLAQDCRRDYLEIDNFQRARDCFDLIGACGIDDGLLRVTYHGSRWYRAEQRHRGLQRWEEKIGRKFPTGEKTQINNSYGCIRIHYENKSGRSLFSLFRTFFSLIPGTSLQGDL